MPTPVKLRTTIVKLIEHADDLRTFVLRPHGTVPRFRPGQFLHLAIDRYDPSQHWPESRVFSIASAPGSAGVQLTVSRKGAFTTRMFRELREGADVWIKLPFGAFTPVLSADRPVVFLAGGTGITPFISFIEWAASRQMPGQLGVHYAARQPELLIYRDVLEAARGGWPSLQVIFYAEHFDDVHAAGDLRAGRISPAEVWSTLATPRTTMFYISGPNAMVGAQREALLALGAEPASLVTDQWD